MNNALSRISVSIALSCLLCASGFGCEHPPGKSGEPDQQHPDDEKQKGAVEDDKPGDNAPQSAELWGMALEPEPLVACGRVIDDLSNMAPSKRGEKLHAACSSLLRDESCQAALAESRTVEGLRRCRESYCAKLEGNIAVCAPDADLSRTGFFTERWLQFFGAALAHDYSWAERVPQSVLVELRSLSETGPGARQKKAFEHFEGLGERDELTRRERHGAIGGLMLMVWSVYLTPELDASGPARPSDSTP